MVKETIVTVEARLKAISISLACVASIPVRSEQNSGHEKEFFAFGGCEKWGKSKKVEGRGWGREWPTWPEFARPEFCSLCKGTLATQATLSQPLFSCVNKSSVRHFRIERRPRIRPPHSYSQIFEACF